jgi:hypothetical protein
MDDLKAKIQASALEVISARYERVKARKFAPLRLLRYRRFLKLIRKVMA